MPFQEGLDLFIFFKQIPTVLVLGHCMMGYAAHYHTQAAATREKAPLGKTCFVLIACDGN